MKLYIDPNKEESGQRAAALGGDLIKEAIKQHGSARIILATGASQFDMMQALVARSDIDWSKCTVFHLDEYIGLSATHPASFVGYLTARFVEQVKDLGHFEAITGLADPAEELARLNDAIDGVKIDVAFIGIGENGHLAFNDPPADFDAKDAYLRVELDEACRTQQVSEGWFPSLEDVPTHAISMSIPQILKSGSIICTVPDDRKAEAVRGAVEGPLSPQCPASSLQTHADTFLFLDAPAASKLSKVSKETQ